MSQSVFVFDTPNSCAECPLSLDTTQHNTNICRGKGEYHFNADSTKKPEWCPLKMLPEKKTYRGERGINANNLHDRICEAIQESAALAWNVCIDVILGNCKEEEYWDETEEGEDYGRENRRNHFEIHS